MRQWPWGDEPFEEAYTATLTGAQRDRIQAACVGDCYQLTEVNGKTLIRATPTAMAAIVEIVEEAGE